MESQVKDQRKAYIFALIAVFFWSTVASAFKLSLEYLSPLELVLYAVLTSIVTLLLIIIYQNKLDLIRPHFKKNFWMILFLGLLNPFLEYIVLFKAYDILPVQEAQTINYTWALMLTYLSIPLLKHKLHMTDFVAGIICYFGVLIIATKGAPFSLEFTNGYGVFLALLTTVFWSLYWIFSTKVKVDPVVGIFCNFLISLPMILIYLWFTQGFRVPEIEGLFGAVYVGLFEMSITFLFWLKAMNHTSSTTKIANLIFIAPFLSLVLIYFIIKEEILFSTITGLVLIIVGLLIQQSGAIKDKVKKQKLKS
jgi:drug/metabolite transporter (DMT)-like permease